MLSDIITAVWAWSPHLTTSLRLVTAVLAFGITAHRAVRYVRLHGERSRSRRETTRPATRPARRR